MCVLELVEDAPSNQTIVNALVKCHKEISDHQNILVSISGGSDSDIMLDMMLRCGGAEKSRFVFFDTGLEYEATKKHLDYLRDRYGVQIDSIPPIKSIPSCVKEHGVPFWSKHVSEMMERLQRHNFKWEDKPLEVLLKEYPKAQSAIKWWCNANGVDGRRSPYNISRVSGLKEFIIASPPEFRISNKCCSYAKKQPAKRFLVDSECDMNCIGIRRAEGGVRQTRFTSCYTHTFSGADEYRPLFWMTDNDKVEYEEHYDILHSDCYRVWGMLRTGCAGCPFAKDFELELELASKYEPKFHKAMLSVFGESYEYTRRFLEFRKTFK